MTSAPTVHPAIAGGAPWQRAVCEYIDLLRARYGDRLSAVVLYGSRARGDADEEGSDVDLLVVLHGQFDDHEEQRIVWDLKGDLEDKYDYPLLCALVATEHDYRQRMLPLYMNIRREGIELWPYRPQRVREERAEYGRTPTDDLRAVLKLASEALGDAHAGLKRRSYRWAANRAYYAMFHAATALLLSEGLAFSRHRGVIGAFTERYVKTGRFPTELGKALDKAFNARNRADYSYREGVSKGEAEQLVGLADQFVAEAERQLGLGE